MIETYKLLSGKYDSQVALNLAILQTITKQKEIAVNYW